MARWRTLLVDDNSALREVLKVTAEADGRFEIIGEAENGAVAIGVAQWLDPDVILLDVAMPVLDGLSAYPRLSEQCPDALVILLTAFDADLLALPAGVKHVNKNAEIVRLFDRIAEFLEQEAA